MASKKQKKASVGLDKVFKLFSQGKDPNSPEVVALGLSYHSQKLLLAMAQTWQT
jgi:hypothetical protein